MILNLGEATSHRWTETENASENLVHYDITANFRLSAVMTGEAGRKV